MSQIAAKVEMTSRSGRASFDIVDRASLSAADRRFVNNDDASCRMFKADWMESLSHVRPWVPHVIFVPVIVGALVAARGVDTAVRTAVLVLGGLVFWSLTEYAIHRSLFHPPQWIEDDTRRIVALLGPHDAVIAALPTLRHKFYFLVHGVHHDYPNDSTRLVMPPSVSIPLAAAFFVLFRAVSGLARGRVRRLCRRLPRLRHDPFRHPSREYPIGDRADVEAAALPASLCRFDPRLRRQLASVGRRAQDQGKEQSSADRLSRRGITGQAGGWYRQSGSSAIGSPVAANARPREPPHRSFTSHAPQRPPKDAVSRRRVNSVDSR